MKDFKVVLLCVAGTIVLNMIFTLDIEQSTFAEVVKSEEKSHREGSDFDTNVPILSLDKDGANKDIDANRYNNEFVTIIQEVKDDAVDDEDKHQDKDQEEDQNQIEMLPLSHPQIQPQPSAVVPIIIGAGLGTTGTHLMAETTCFLGYPSIHHFVGCVNVDDDMMEKYQKAAEMHFKILKDIKRGAGCVKGGCKNISAMEFRASLKQSIREFVSYIRTDVTPIEDDNNDTIPIALHDTPWPLLIPSLIEEIEKQYNGLSPLILLSERDPLHYTQKRLGKGHAIRDIMCKNHTQQGAFDIIGCIDEALDGLSEEESRNLKLIDVLTTMQLMRGVEDSDGFERIVAEVKGYQDYYRDRADFSYDMFIQEGRTDREDLSNKMLSVVKKLKKVGKPCDYWNWRKNVPSNRLSRKRRT